MIDMENLTLFSTPACHRPSPAPADQGFPHDPRCAALTGAPGGGHGGVRRFTMSTLAALAIIPMSAISAHAWEPLGYQSLTTTDAQPAIQTAWSDIIASNAAYWRDELHRTIPAGQIPPLDILSKPIKVRSHTFIVSIASTRECETGANNASSSIEPDLCEARIIDPDSGKIVARAEACYVDLSDDDRPQANRNDRTEIDVQANAKEIHFRSFVGGKEWSRCTTSAKLP
ncbi:hypothetical protein ACFSQT_02175 [Mesorhizobium calcicola]|uniref:Uncharacterized protein n=1 Tax=Mesorhizobium calcicola TaxID=1300310 RepID=A0ABW4W7H8_9HYPH